MPLNSVEEIQTLANSYLAKEVVPPNKLLDALHIACAVVNEIDFLVSWNYKHLANVNREKKVMLVNVANNYLKPMRIITPIELIDYGK